MSVIRLAERKPTRVSGFTLVEILIVISIISVLASMVLVGVQHARQGANIALAKTSVSDLTSALQRYVQDEGEYPGMALEADAQRNDFPLLFVALFGERRPKGKGGRSAPYTSPKEDDIVIYDDSLGAYRNPERHERFDEDVRKFLRDPWGEPFVYRANKGKSRAEHDFMKNANADIYSLGPDGIDQTSLGENGDDVGNW
jgi:prepilin-type N-terminal cleavage/methylation domain-containing protein